MKKSSTSSPKKVSTTSFVHLGIEGHGSTSKISEKMRGQGFSSGVIAPTLKRGDLGPGQWIHALNFYSEQKLFKYSESAPRIVWLDCAQKSEFPLGPGISNEILYQGLLKARAYNILVIAANTTSDFIGIGEMHEGPVSFKTGLRGIPSLGEELWVARLIEFARSLKTPIHILKISTQRSVELVKQARSKGILITASVPRENLIWDQEICQDFHPDYKCLPPLRSSDDRKALLKGLSDGVIEAIVSSPWSDRSARELKQIRAEASWESSPWMGPAMENFISELYHHCVRTGELTWDTLQRALTVGPKTIIKDYVPYEIQLEKRQFDL